MKIETRIRKERDNRGTNVKLYVRDSETDPWRHVDDAPEEHIADVAQDWIGEGYAEENIKVEEI